MLSRVWAIALLAATSVAAQSPPTLIDALNESGASKFAALISSDPELLALFTSGQIGTVFAPSDNSSSMEPPLSQRALSPKEQRAAKYQAAKQETDVIQASQSLPGTVIETADNSALLGDKGNVIVTDIRPSNVSSNSANAERRWGAKRADGGSPQSLLRISSGRGNVVNVINGDIAFAGGLIHILDDYFTVPESLSATSNATGHSSFANLASSANMTSELDKMQSITVFVPSNEAFSLATNSSAIAPAKLLGNHVVTGFTGYLPNLKDGAVLKTQSGESLTISVRGSDYFVNGAKITTANMILENGVAHAIDTVLTPDAAPPDGGIVPSEGALSIKTAGLSGILGAVIGGLALLALA